jgi:hypothetical protein
MAAARLEAVALVVNDSSCRWIRRHPPWMVLRARALRIATGAEFGLAGEEPEPGGSGVPRVDDGGTRDEVDHALGDPLSDQLHRVGHSSAYDRSRSRGSHAV